MTEESPDTIDVEVVWADPETQTVVELALPPGSTLQQAVETSGLQEKFSDLELRADRVGIFGQKATLDTVLRQGDRVEIYRPLLIDPKEARRLKAETQKKRKAEAGG